MKYHTPADQDEILPNIPGYKTLEEITISEFEGFVSAEIILTERLTQRTKFNCAYILSIHKMALAHLYPFAGKYRDVNMSKGGFQFAAARFLPQTMAAFEQNILKVLPGSYEHENELIRDIAKVHAELLFIHPFREGNGRTARVLANLMCRKQGYATLNFDLIKQEAFEIYVTAVQAAAGQDYRRMEELIRLIFPK
jgi:cell filamentation protein